MGIRLHKDWAYYALFQYFWILVILPKAVQLLALGALMCVMWLKSGSEKPLDKFSILQLIFLLIYGVSIVVNTLRGGHELSRIFAAINTWLITAVALSLYHLYRHAQIDLHRIGRFALCNLVILIFLWVVYKITQGNYAFTVLGHSLSGPDWVNGLYAPRFLGYMDYANLVVFSVLFFYPLALFFLRDKKVAVFILTAALFLVVKATNSRTGLVLYLLVFLAYFLFETQKQFFDFYRQRKYALFGLVLIMVPIVLVFGLGYIVKILNSMMQMREGSNNMRAMIYAQSLSLMWKQSPIIGIGIKDMFVDYPLGSHSTYIGALYKAGILGGPIYIITILISVIHPLLRKDADRHAVCLKVCMLVIILMMMLEDIDGASWCICIFYILLAFLKNEHRLFRHTQNVEENNYEQTKD